MDVEKTNLSEKVTAELDLTLKKAVREKLQLKEELDVVMQQKVKLQKDFNELQEMYNKQVRLNL